MDNKQDDAVLQHRGTVGTPPCTLIPFFINLRPGLSQRKESMYRLSDGIVIVLWFQVSTMIQ